jgi:hypothetical protein
MEEKTNMVHQYLPDLSPDAINQALIPLIKTYLTSIHTESQEEIVENVSQAIEASIRQTEPRQRRFFILQQIQQLKLGGRLAGLKQAEHLASVETDAIIDRQIAVLEAARDFIEIFREDQTSVECPACGRQIETFVFVEHVTASYRNKCCTSFRNAVIQKRKELQEGIFEVRKWFQEQDLRSWLKKRSRES